MYYTTSHNYKILGPQSGIRQNNISIIYFLEKVPGFYLSFRVYMERSFKKNTFEKDI